MNRRFDTWRAVGASVVGPSHSRTSTPNQDAWAVAEDGSRFVLAVSDGHGSRRCFRSDVGARLAVAVAIDELMSFSRRHEELDLQMLEDTAAAHLGPALVTAWRERVDRHRSETPFTPAETAGVSNAPQPLEARPYLPYGATLLATIATPGYLLHLQLGDGDILSVAGDGTVERPVPGDARVFGGETTSLCLDDAASTVRFRVVPGDAAPALVLISSDGYANSFRSDEDFLKIGPDYLEFIRGDGLEAVESGLPGILRETTAAGSGDDITLGILWRGDPG